MRVVAFSPDGRHLVTGSPDKSARLRETETGREVRRFASHQHSAVAGVAFSPDGRIVAIGNYDGTTQLAATSLAELVSSACGRLLRDFTAEERQIYGIADDEPTCSSPNGSG